MSIQRLMGKPTSPALRQAMLQRQRRLHARRRVEQEFVLSAVQDILDELADHPSLPYVICSRWPHATVDDPDLPRDWIEKAARTCRRILRQNPWHADPPDRLTLPTETLRPLARLLRDIRHRAGVAR